MLLGLLFRYPEYIPKAKKKLDAKCFYLNTHRLIYLNIINYHNQDNKKSKSDINSLYLLNKLSIGNFISNLERVEIFLDMYFSPISIKFIDNYSLIITENYIRRTIIEHGRSIIAHGLSAWLNFEDIENLILSTKIDSKKFPFATNYDSNHKKFNLVIDNIINNIQKGNEYKNVIKSGFDSLDKITDGFNLSDLIIIAGRPAVGKTAFCLNLALNIINNTTSGLLFFSLEMSIEQLVYRLVSIKCSLQINKIKKGRLTDKEYQLLSTVTQELDKSNFYFDNSSYLSIDNIKNKIDTLNKQKKSVNVIIIDYLQLMISNGNFDTRSQELSRLTRSLKILARDLNLSVIVLSQLNRNVEQRTNKRPLLSDLRESGCISKKTNIRLPNQSLSLQKLINKKDAIITVFNIKNYHFTYSSSKIFSTGYKPIYRLTTLYYKYYLDITHDHKILTAKGWKRCYELIEGDYIFTSKNEINQINPIIEFDKIDTIYHLGMEDVFDISTTNNIHNFIANNIIIHNSIEQDADLVILLNKVHENTENDNIYPIEFIIAKNRNGPIGTFNLNFKSNMTKFIDKYQ